MKSNVRYSGIYIRFQKTKKINDFEFFVVENVNSVGFHNEIKMYY